MIGSSKPTSRKPMSHFFKNFDLSSVITACSDLVVQLGR
jgi:hypothetical protein